LPNLFSCQISSSLACFKLLKPQQTPLQRVWVLLIPESCKLQNSSNPMFDANFQIDAQHQADLLPLPGLRKIGTLVIQKLLPRQLATFTPNRRFGKPELLCIGCPPALRALQHFAIGSQPRNLLSGPDQSPRHLAPWRPSIRIDATLDLRDPLLMLQDQHRDSDRAADDDCHDRHQQPAQTHNRID